MHYPSYGVFETLVEQIDTEDCLTGPDKFRLWLLMASFLLKNPEQSKNWEKLVLVTALALPSDVEEFTALSKPLM